MSGGASGARKGIATELRNGSHQDGLGCYFDINTAQGEPAM